MSARTKIEKLEDLIKESVNGKLVEQTLETLVPPGENFGSVIYKVDFKVKNGEEEKTYHAVAKCTPPNQVTQEMFNIQVTIKSEIGWYTTVIPTIKNFQREHGVEQEADFFQNFYGSRISLDPTTDIVDIDAVILTENLKPLGYRNVDRHIGFDLKTSKAILKDLAIFHAVPLAIRLKNNTLFEKNIRPYLTGMQFKADPERKDSFDIFEIALKGIPEISPYMDKIENHFKKNKLHDEAPIFNEAWASVCHNDFWINNIMVKDGDDPKTVFLDFQLASYGSIAYDVLFLLIVSVELEVIKEHMDELLKFYWDEFLKNIKLLDLDDSSYTYEEFLKEVEATSSVLLGRSLFHTFVVLADKAYTNFDSSNENFKIEDWGKFRITLNDKHNEKYKWIIFEFVKRGWM